MDLVYHPPRQRGLIAGVILVVWPLVMASLLLAQVVGWPISLPTFVVYAAAVVFLALASLFAYLTYSCLTLRYTIDRDAFTIQWGGLRRVIPLARIQRMVPGYSLRKKPHIRGLNWVGYHIGQAQVEPIGPTFFYSTHQSPEELLYIVTEEGNYAISTHNINWLIREVQQRQSQGPLGEATPPLSNDSLWSHPFWRDRHAQVLALVAVALNVALFAFLFAIYQGLPDNLSLSFPQPLTEERLGPKGDLVQIPLIALAILGINVLLAALLHRRELALARLFLVAAIAAQMVMWVAAGISIA